MAVQLVTHSPPLGCGLELILAVYREVYAHCFVLKCLLQWHVHVQHAKTHKSQRDYKNMKNLSHTMQHITQLSGANLQAKPIFPLPGDMGTQDTVQIQTTACKLTLHMKQFTNSLILKYNTTGICAATCSKLLTDTDTIISANMH